MSFYKHGRDFDGELVYEGIEELKVVRVDVSTLLNEFVVIVPKGAFGVIFTSLPLGLGLTVSINNGDYFSVLESGVRLSPFLNLIDSMVLKTNTVKMGEEVEILFLCQKPFN